jgi:hypothetical protein
MLYTIILKTIILYLYIYLTVFLLVYRSLEIFVIAGDSSEYYKTLMQEFLNCDTVNMLEKWANLG